LFLDDRTNDRQGRRECRRCRSNFAAGRHRRP